MTLTTQQILSAVRRKVLEQSSDIVQDDVILLYANQAYNDLKIRSFTNDQIQSATITLTNGVGTLPTNFGTLYGPGYKSTTDRTPYNEKSIADFDRNPYEEGITIEGGQIKVNPSTTPQIIIKYWPSYEPLSASQNPELNSYLHEPIIYGTVYRVHEDLQNEALAKYYKDEYEADVEKRISKLSNYQEENNRGGEMFNGIKMF